MGVRFVDQYSLLHFAVGIVIYFCGLPCLAWILIQIGFEWIENSNWGIFVINQYLPFWPGGKPHADTLNNSCGDIISGTLGWLIARTLDQYGRQQGWNS